MSDCDRLREIGAEVALGIADGQERAWALDHLAECAGCRARIERLSALADELLLLSPAVEPPAGFEGRVAASIDQGAEPARGRPRWTRRLVTPAVAGLAAACAAVAVWLALSDDRELADSYRATLAVANGEYFDATPVSVPGGEEVGYVYGYQGRTSWVLAVIYDGVRAGRYRLQAVTGEGQRIALSDLRVAGDGRGSTGTAIPVSYDDLSEVRLLTRSGRQVADSNLRE